MKNPSVNRCLKDNMFDNIDHALGRPINPMEESYRNYFEVNPSSDLELKFRESIYWDELNSSDKSCIFNVNQSGRKALKNQLLEIGEKNKLYEVFLFDYLEPLSVLAENKSKAKYICYLEILDSFEDLSFIDFCKNCRVRLIK